ncbi:MAG: thiosulfate oxidation carrier protein SoxY [Hyphomicrobiales bacterium]|nr:thiosulfate oxidation carrier protein SoxY [Hyphomicrobiales bacterium]
MNAKISRREALAGGAAACASGAVTLRSAEAADPMAARMAAAQAAIKKFTGGKATTKGALKLTLPQIAENGNTVPMGVSVDSPMTAASYVKEVRVFVPKNPLPVAVSFLFTPESGKAAASTHIRLAGTQDVQAIALMSDGTFLIDTRNCKVTIGGCGG